MKPNEGIVQGMQDLLDHGAQVLPFLRARWAGLPIDSPLHGLKNNSVQGNGETDPSLPFLGHSQFLFPAIKAIWSKCTSRATGNTFSSFDLSLSITFFFERTPRAFLSFSEDGHWGLPLGLCRSWAPGGDLGWCQPSRGGSTASGTGTSPSSTHSPRWCADVFSLFQNCFTGLMREQDSAAGSRGGFF